MLESIHIQGFKGFKDTTIGPLRKVNLIVGGQNVGKTSLLEAVYAVTNSGLKLGHFVTNHGATSSGFAQLASAFRVVEGQDAQRYVDRALRGDFKFIEARFSEGLLRFQAMAQLEQGGERFDTLSSYGEWSLLCGSGAAVHPANPAVPISLHLPSQSDQVNLFGKIVLGNKKHELLELLKQIEPRLQDLNAASPDGEQRIYAAVQGVANALPTQQLGHGFARLLYLFNNMLVTDSKLALIDEVENGIHYSALPTLMQGIKNVARDREVQTLMTTHSMDCIKAASKVFEDSPDDFQVIRLVRTADNIEADIIPADAVRAVLDSDGEIR